MGELGEGENLQPSEGGADASPKPERARIQRLVRDSSDKVVASLRPESGFSARYVLGNVAQALVDTEGIESAHKYVSHALSEFADLQPADEFGVWADLVKKGDTSAIPLARRAAGIAGEDVPFVEAIGAMQLGGLHSAERLVELVEAGDAESIPLARGIAKNAFVVDRAALFGKLYKAGDWADSLDGAIDAARDAKAYTEQTGDQHYHRSEQALSDMASFAIDNGRIDDALKLMERMEDASGIANLHAKLFAKGRTESLQVVKDYLETASEYQKPFLERALAEAGDAHAQLQVRRRVFPQSTRKMGFGRREAIAPPGFFAEDQLRDLVTLYKTGDKTVASKVAELVKTNDHPEYLLHYLRAVDLPDEERALAQQLYDADPSNTNAEHLLYTGYDEELWKKIFDYWQDERHDAWQSSGWVRYLGSHAKSLEN